MGRIVGLILFVGCILIGCQGASEQPLESDNLAAQSGQIIHHVFFGSITQIQSLINNN